MESAKPWAVSPPPAGHSRRGNAGCAGRSGREGSSQAAGRGKPIRSPAQGLTGLAAEAPAAREAGGQLGRAFQSGPSRETQARPFGSWGHRDSLVCAAQDPTDSLPLHQALQRWRQPPDPGQRATRDWASGSQEDRTAGRRPGDRVPRSLRDGNRQTQRDIPRGGWERVTGASRLLPSNSSSSSGPSRRQGRRRRSRTVRRYRLSVRRPRASRCPSRSSSRASECPQRSASWRSRLSAARWLTSRSSASGCGGLRGHKRWGTTVRR